MKKNSPLFSSLKITGLALFTSFQMYSQQNVGIGTNAPDASSALEVTSPANNQGILVPRLTTAQRLAIATPANSLLVYDTNFDCFFYYIAATTTWQSMCANSGSAGPTGPTGAAGAPGSNGAPGAAGANGISCWDLNGDGITDPSEDINGDGSWNALDCAGAAGVAGANGATGAAGAAGATGVSCWDTDGDGVNDPGEDVNADGFWNTLDCVAGVVGPTGPTGTAGATGPSGIDGVNGTNGATGPSGIDGINGTNGTNGATGPTGPSGIDGVNGTNGTNGATGPTGAAGATGSTGAAGAPGSIGPTGAAGATGSTGAAGSPGSIGPTGAAGATGPTGPGTICGAAATNYITKFTSATTMCNSNIFDNGTNIGVYTATPLNFWHFRKTTSTGVWDCLWENTGTSDGVSQFYNSAAANGSRVVMGVTNYNANAFQASGVMGLALNAAGSGGEGVTGFCNSTAGNGVYGGFVGGTLFTSTGWAIYGDGWAGGLTAWQNVSDARLKKNVKTLDGSLSKVMKLRGVEYNFSKANYPDVNMDENAKQIGFIAQEVEQVFPEIVREANLYSSMNASTAVDAKRNTYLVKTLSYSTLVPVLVEAMKEQQKQIEELKKQVEELKNK